MIFSDVLMFFFFLQVDAALFFKMLYREHFPNSSSILIEEECKWTLRSMSDSLRRAAEDGILFSGGNAGRFGPAHRAVVGDGSVCRDESPELQRTFGRHNTSGLHLYAMCYEFTHWEPVMTALGKFFRLILISVYLLF